MLAKPLSCHPASQRLICGRGVYFCPCTDALAQTHALAEVRNQKQKCLVCCYAHRRIALFNLEEFESAKEAFEAAHALDRRRESEIWIRKCNAELEGGAHTSLLFFKQPSSSCAKVSLASAEGMASHAQRRWGSLPRPRHPRLRPTECRDLQRLQHTHPRPRL